MAVWAHVTAAVGAFVADCLSSLEDGRILDRVSGGLGSMSDDHDQGQEGKYRQEGVDESLHVAVSMVCGVRERK